MRGGEGPRGAAPLSLLFARLSAARDQMGVLECSLSQCTLEQVFILMACWSPRDLSTWGVA